MKFTLTTKRFKVGSKVTCFGKNGTVISIKDAIGKGADASKTKSTYRGVLFEDGTVTIVHVGNLSY